MCRLDFPDFLTVSFKRCHENHLHELPPSSPLTEVKLPWAYDEEKDGG